MTPSDLIDHECNDDGDIVTVSHRHVFITQHRNTFYAKPGSERSDAIAHKNGIPIYGEGNNPMAAIESLVASIVELDATSELPRCTCSSHRGMTRLIEVQYDSFVTSLQVHSNR